MKSILSTLVLLSSITAFADCTFRADRPTFGHSDVDRSAIAAMASKGYTYSETSSNMLTAKEENCRTSGLSTNPLNWPDAPWVIKCDLVLELQDANGNSLDEGMGYTKILGTARIESGRQVQSPPWGFRKSKSNATKMAISEFKACE